MIFGATFGFTDVKTVNLSIRWMPSHLQDDEKARPPEASDLDITCNQKADELAGDAAELLCLPSGIATDFLHYVDLVNKMKKRIVSMISALPCRNKVIRDKPQTEADKRPNLERLLLSTTHKILIRSNRLHCTACSCFCKKNFKDILFWLQSNCSELEPMS